MTVRTRTPWPAAVQKKHPKFPPALSAAEELKTFHMAPGYQVQLVASEPLVVDPIVAEFDGNGRLWVVEMQGYAVGTPLPPQPALSPRFARILFSVRNPPRKPFPAALPTASLATKISGSTSGTLLRLTAT